MPRKAFIADLKSLAEQSCADNVSDVKAGADDGEFVFTYQHPKDGSRTQISAMIPDLSDYPKHRDIHVFASQEASTSLAQALDAAPRFSMQPVPGFLQVLSLYLNKKLNSGAVDDNGDLDLPDSEDPEDDDLEAAEDEPTENEDWVLEEDAFTNEHIKSSRTDTIDGKKSESLARARSDLRAIKDAGFKVGLVGSLQQGCSIYVSVSCRIRKLGISEEVLGAWHLDPSNYLILLIHYPVGHQSLEYLTSVDQDTARARVRMEVGVSKSYKVDSVQEARFAFNRDADKAQEVANSEKSGLQDFFLSRPLSSLLNERLYAILKCRWTTGLSWKGAETLYDQSLGMLDMSSGSIENLDMQEDPQPELPKIVTADELSFPQGQEKLSFPLLAMQFLLRHFTRCTEFCLVCHRKLETQIEAIKPYVCDSPLCLFQYMNLGFGPSIEHEVLEQAFVVDLLISFAYNAACQQSLKSYPDGLGLTVPRPVRRCITDKIEPPAAPKSLTFPVPPAKRAKKEADIATSKSYECRLKEDSHELLFNLEIIKKCPLKKGDWLLLEISSHRRHYRVSDATFFPCVKLNAPALSPVTPLTQENANYATVSSSWTPVTITLYDQNFDDLEQEEKCHSILTLLDLLPSVRELGEYLTRRPGVSLSSWVERIPPASLSLLRWILASNRSCIQQVDQPFEPGTEKTKRRLEERVYGVPGWLQFRFAMGAPDKEQRFLNAIASRPANEYPTLFAWHGSPLRNWHSIIREGLHFETTTHGRSYGNGCYHALEFNASAGYSGQHAPSQPNMTHSDEWPNSILRIRSAVALSEIVNSPEEFVSQRPYYVVSELDWIQTRYLFVLPHTPHPAEEEQEPLRALKQEPRRTPVGPNGAPTVLPLTAIAKSRRQTATKEPPVTGDSSGQPANAKGLKAFFAGTQTASKSDQASNPRDDWDTESIDTQPEDLEILFEPKERRASLPPSPAPSPARPVAQIPVTDFVLGPVANLPLMPLPKYATSVATKRLQKDFRNLLSVQELHIKKNNLKELGWYVDPEHLSKTDNLYQWIVMLHSFPLTLPLAVDMQSARIQSVVLEIRYHASYPFSPPFIRVVKPRFLPFANGGGGHVTAGGSICMELLNSSGWSAAHDIESVLLQVRMAIMSTDPRPARLLHANPNHGHASSEYGISEAVESFKRASRMHSWEIPDVLDEMASVP